jgi:hypothetical protein
MGSLSLCELGSWVIVLFYCIFLHWTDACRTHPSTSNLGPHSHCVFLFSSLLGVFAQRSLCTDLFPMATSGSATSGNSSCAVSPASHFFAQISIGPSGIRCSAIHGCRPVVLSLCCVVSPHRNFFLQYRSLLGSVCSPRLSFFSSHHPAFGGLFPLLIDSYYNNPYLPYTCARKR